MSDLEKLATMTVLWKLKLHCVKFKYRSVQLLYCLYKHVWIDIFIDWAGKPVPPKNVTSTSKKKNVSRSGLKGKSNPAAVTLTNYFKMKAKADHFHSGGSTPLEKQDGKKFSSPGGDQTVTPSKKKATSLILFEEVKQPDTNRYNTACNPCKFWFDSFICSRRSMLYLTMMLVSSEPSRLSWQRLKDQSFWPPMVKANIVQLWIHLIWRPCDEN